MNKYIEHFKTITRHKYYVTKACFKAGIPIQGLLHDLSKYSFKEFFTSARYFQGTSSPIDAEKNEKQYSEAWLNHKSKNKHHWQYWLDTEGDEMLAITMPPKYLSEMICDWVGAGKAYNKDKWSIETFKSWYYSNKNNIYISEITRASIESLMNFIECEADIYRYANPNNIIMWYAQDELECGKKYVSRFKVNKNVK